MSFTKHIPNTITCGNLFCGCLAILKAFEGDLQWCAYLVGIAAVLDFLDGFAARMLKAYSAVGKDLDSLADMVTFGVVPGLVLFKMIAFLTGTYITSFNMEAIKDHPEGLLPYAGFVVIIFSALRLAMFNNDTRQTDSFIGLPTPANAILICSLPLVFNFESYQDFNAFASFFMDAQNLAIMGCVLSLLMITEVPLFSLKFRNFNWQANRLRYIFLLGAATLLVGLKTAGIPLAIVFYILLSIVDNIFLKKEV
jgi:CDP-diacylglycerol--serine O-phosphatidyltransferase